VLHGPLDAFSGVSVSLNCESICNGIEQQVVIDEPELQLGGQISFAVKDGRFVRQFI